MSYPMVEVFGLSYREMSPEDYEEELQWYRDYLARHENDIAAPRRIEEYTSYLHTWFGDGSCDGLPDFNTRYAYHTLPMSFNVYFNG